MLFVKRTGMLMISVLFVHFYIVYLITIETGYTVWVQPALFFCIFL